MTPPAPTAQPPIAFDITNQKGFAARVEVTVPTVQYSSSIANTSPGFIDLSTPLAFEAAISNLTPGRNADWNLVFDVYSAYPAAAAVCQMGKQYQGAWIVTSSGHCYVQIGQLAAMPVRLAPGETVSLPRGLLSAPAGTKVPYTQSSANLPDVPEARAQAVLEAVNKPDGFAVGVSARVGASAGPVAYPSACQSAPVPDASGATVMTNFVAVSDAAACG